MPASAYHQRLHALDVATGAELLGGPTEIAAILSNRRRRQTPSTPNSYAERAALLLSNGTIYTSFTSHCDGSPYSGWIIAFAQSSPGAISGVLNVAAKQQCRARHLDERRRPGAPTPPATSTC